MPAKKVVLMDLHVEIVGDEVVCRQGGTRAFSAPLKDLVAALAERSDLAALPQASPDGVRFVKRRGEAVVLVTEGQPQTRTVRWLADESPVPFGRGATYRNARISFPWIVTVILFRSGGLTGYQQCFYRTEPLSLRSDQLLLPNLYNVADGYGLRCWLCLANLQKDLSTLSWRDKVNEVRQHLWGGAFNRSSEVHEGMSYWGAMRNIDRRFETLEAWERASSEDPFFPLKVAWKPAGKTVEQVMDDLIARVCPQVPDTVAQIAQLISVLAARPSTRSVATV
jgi:hypothetical protein